jgi:hypothetical protein
MSGPVEVACDLGTVKVIPFGGEQVQLRMRLGLRGQHPIETVLLLTRTQALQIADALTSGDLVELIEAARQEFFLDYDEAPTARLGAAVGRFR